MPTPATPPRVGPKTLANPKPTRVGKGGSRGAKPPWQGAVGGVSPQRQKRERVAHISEPATSGTQNVGKPQANGGGKMGGSRGPQAPWRGAVGVPPHKDKRGNELPTLATPPRVGPKTLANPKPTGVGKGVQGAKPPGRGFGGCAPKNQERGRVANPCNPARSGTQNAGEPSAYGGGKKGVQGAKPPWRGAVGGVPPQNQKKGRVAHISNPATSGAQNVGEP